MERYPERVEARHAIREAKKKGTIEVPSTCSSCGNETKVHAHHDDYSKPLDVIWPCWPCHRKLHGNRH